MLPTKKNMHVTKKSYFVQNEFCAVSADVLTLAKYTIPANVVQNKQQHIDKRARSAHPVGLFNSDIYELKITTNGMPEMISAPCVGISDMSQLIGGMRIGGTKRC